MKEFKLYTRNYVYDFYFSKKLTKFKKTKVYDKSNRTRIQV